MTWKSIVFFVALAALNCKEAVALCNEYSPCVRFCCDNCTIDLDVSDQPGADTFLTDYSPLLGRPCTQMFVLEPEDYPDDIWSFIAVSGVRRR